MLISSEILKEISSPYDKHGSEGGMERRSVTKAVARVYSTGVGGSK